MDTLESTNKRLTDLERKLSIVSDTLLTQYSQASSVVINRNHDGAGKQSVSSVLLYIRNNQDGFDTNELFEERQRMNRNGNPNEVPENLSAAIDFRPADLVDEDLFDEYDYEEDDDDDDVELLPPSPPRSPPREIDPDKLYGLYEFSGPDPLHCTLSRDEPVYLLNDDDDYWWLIQKLSKEERGTDENGKEEEGIEDGKIGFVPAECLETFGERLARLNCFRNEELEKNLRGDNLIDETLLRAKKVDSKYRSVKFDLGGPLEGSLTEEGHPTIDVESIESENAKQLGLEIPGSHHRPIVVTDDESDTDEEHDTPRQQFPDQILSIPAGELGRPQSMGKVDPPKDGLLSPPTNGSAPSEVLSDLFPDATPLVIAKSNKKKKTTKPETATEGNVPEDSNIFTKPPTIPKKLPDMLSIGSFSPDTPPLKNGWSPNPERDAEAFRRSVILERLNQMTADIQEQFEIPDESYSDMENIMFGGMDSNDEYSDDAGSLNSTVRHSTETGLDSDVPTQNEDESLTPLTSTASLVERKERDKTIHDMFVPILGKFDELAERLAELNGMI